MAEGKRPGGLTALAVLNFVFGGLGALGFLTLLALFGYMDSATDGELSDAFTEVPEKGLLVLSVVLSLVAVVAEITSGVGYLKQKRFMGRTVGNVYALAAIANLVLGMSFTAFGIGTMIALVYPVLTLALINTTFADDLVN
jgi:uncharacterized membrane protein YkvI